MTANHVVFPTAPHSHTVIFLHGRDSIAAEFADEIFESQASDGRTLPDTLPGFKWVFPTCGLRASARFDTELSQWFDIWSVEEPEERKGIQIQGLSDSIASIGRIVAQEAFCLPANRIILAGISQGCATAIHAMLQATCKMGAFVGFSSWLPFRKEVEEITRNSTTISGRLQALRSLPFARKAPLVEGMSLALDTPVFLGHSEDDEIVPVRHGRKLCDALNGLGFSVEWHVYEDGGHWVNEPQGIDDLVAFLRRVC
ncbi:phospholipase/Carboxylesterase [Macrophomina phaseolina]|uniref:Phospholipase/Carboxylesterase n=1 Tax=Macrophomina phaseolina TaxID=35725 RepID=A0ABQ8G9V8_9PEZI|nr:phospholipase/Carboxylesterase [Macrophomina phaseolina]